MNSFPEHALSALGPDAERQGELTIAVLHCMVALSAPTLFGDVIETRPLAIWVAAEAIVALLCMLAFVLVHQNLVRAYRRVSSMASIGTVLVFASLPWLGDDLASTAPSMHVLMIILLAATALASISATNVSRRRSNFSLVLGGLAASYGAAYLVQGSLVFALLSAAWAIAIFVLTKVGREGLAELLELRRASEVMARHDDLTGLLSRSAFFEALTTQIENDDVDNARTALVLFDLDGFKAINDSFGHPAGDAVLRAVAKRLELYLPTGAIIGRLGGDEFAATFPVGQYLLDPAIEASLNAVSEPISIDGREVYVAASAGWTLLDEGETAADLVAQADAAMYQSKNSATSVSIGFDSDLRKELDRSLDIRQRFRTALKRKEILYFAQPLVRTSDGAPVAIELLARWPQLDDTVIGPMEFTRVADETGLAVELDQQALEMAAGLLQNWNKDPALQHLVVKANVSPVHLHNNDLIESVRSLVPSHLQGRLGLEMIESRLIPAAERNHLQLQALIDMGITLSIDDFGVGYSSLAYLRTLPVSEIKIDRSFVTNLDTDPINRGLMQAIVDIASTLGIPTVAEGVETAAEYSAVARLGVSSAQGYHVGHPVPMAEIEDVLRAMHVAAATVQL